VRTRLSGPEWVLLGLLAAWTFVPLAFLLADGRTLTGADGVIGADQLQYLAWVRDAADHGLAANRFDLRAQTHDFAHPMFTLSGALVALGVSVQLAYLVWKPVAVAALALGAFAWVRRLLPGRPRAQAAAAALALLSFSPLAALALWTDAGSDAARADLLSTAAETFTAGSLWGYLPTVVAIGLMPLVILAVERGSTQDRRGALLAAAGMGVLVSWLHPWQGVTLVLILAGLVAFPGQPPRQRLVLAVPAAGLLAPLAYYALLSRLDDAWELSARVNEIGTPPVWVLLAVLLPLAVPAVYGLRRPGEDLVERALVLWIAAGLASYAFLPPFPPHALGGLGLPLAVLAVRGWERLRAPAWVGAAAVALMVIPGGAYVARELHRATDSPAQQLWLAGGDADALRHVREHSPPGGVLAPFPLAAAVPAHTGRPVWMGHLSWTPDFYERAGEADALFTGRMAPALAQAFVRDTGARIVIAGCRDGRDLRPLLRDSVATARRFGCASVYEMRP
jgi:hypothetical protein